jgi:D-tyrosyl-tRNA(Tyr) deacylase
MKILLQRVSSAQVTVEGRIVSRVGRGLLLLVGIGRLDGAAELEWMAHKAVNLRVFPDAAGKMNLSVRDVKGELMAVSQFTLYADAHKGNRPSYVDAAPPEQASILFDRFCEMLERELGGPISRGVFGAHMNVELVNDGPVTLMLEKAATP